MVAGPSEVLVGADGSAPLEWVALDVFAQAEHDAQAQAIAIVPSEEIAQQLLATMTRLLPSMDRRTVIETSLQRHGAIICMEDEAKIPALIDRIAPEHLELMHHLAHQWLPLITTLARCS